MAEKKTDDKDGKKKPMILIKKVKKVAGGHHGGAWKVAYADFVTAMMAFFLLLWLLNVSTKEQLDGIADYFTPTTASQSTSGAGGVMGGLNMTTEGSQANNNKLTASTNNRPSDAEEDNKEMGDKKNKPTNEEEKKKADEEDIKKAKAEEEEKQFKQAMSDLKQAIDQDPSLKDLANNLIVDMTPEGLRIQIVDQQGKSMFPLGSAKMYDETNLMISKVSQVVGKLPQKISVRGHTDGVPYGTSATYDNWNLSADRANASRQALIQAGLDPKRIANVTGKADTEHLFPNDPSSPQNRRISIILLREYPSDKKDVQGN